MKFVRNLEHVTRKDRSVAGGKAASLGEMMQTGFPVPRGFVVLSGAFERTLDENDLHAKVRGVLDSIRYDNTRSVKNGSRKLQALVLKAKLPEDVALEIREAFDMLGARRVAVRSSATAEDSAEAAWAGQLDTYLNTTEEDLLTNVKKVWASLFSPHALVYRSTKGERKQKVSVAVVVQAMVRSTAAGVAFSVHPVTQDPAHLVIEAGHGLGGAVASGRTTPDRYVVRKKPRRIVEKEIRTKKRILSDAQIRTLAKHVLDIEKHFGFPCDIEWALAKNAFSILQSRPITTLSEKPLDSWIVVGSRRANVLNASMRSLAWSKCLKKEIGVGFSEIYILSTGEHIVRHLDETKVEKAIGASRRSVDDFISGMYDLKRKLAVRLGTEKLTGEGIREFPLLLTYFYIARLFSESIYTDAPKKVKERIEKWRNDESLFEPYDMLSEYLSKQISLPIPVVNLLTIEEIAAFLDKKSKISERMLSRRTCNEWTIVNKDGNVRFIDKIVWPQGFVADTGQKTFEETVIRGDTASKGYAKGKVRLIADAKSLKKIRTGEIIVAQMVAPSFGPAIQDVSAVITDEGGITSHAAIIAREMGIPCIVKTKTATKILETGDLVEVDANAGLVKILKRK